MKGSLTQECRLDFFLTNHIPPARPLSNTHIGAISNFFRKPAEILAVHRCRCNWRQIISGMLLPPIIYRRCRWQKSLNLVPDFHRCHETGVSHLQQNQLASKWTLSKNTFYECKQQPSSISKIRKKFLSQHFCHLSPVRISVHKGTKLHFGAIAWPLSWRVEGGKK